MTPYILFNYISVVKGLVDIDAGQCVIIRVGKSLEEINISYDADTLSPKECKNLKRLEDDELMVIYIDNKNYLSFILDRTKCIRRPVDGKKCCFIAPEEVNEKKSKYMEEVYHIFEEFMLIEPFILGQYIKETENVVMVFADCIWATGVVSNVHIIRTNYLRDVRLSLKSLWMTPRKIKSICEDIKQSSTPYFAVVVLRHKEKWYCRGYQLGKKDVYPSQRRLREVYQYDGPYRLARDGYVEIEVC